MWPISARPYGSLTHSLNLCLLLCDECPKVRAGSITEDEYHTILRVTRSASNAIEEEDVDADDGGGDAGGDEAAFEDVPLETPGAGSSPKATSPSPPWRLF